MTALLRRARHRLAHALGWFAGRVDTRWVGEPPQRLEVFFTCATCGRETDVVPCGDEVGLGLSEKGPGLSDNPPAPSDGAEFAGPDAW